MKKLLKSDLFWSIVIVIVGVLFMLLLSNNAERYDKTHPVEKSPAYYNNEILPEEE